MSDATATESAAETAARLFEVNRLIDSTDAAVSKACEEVGAVFLDDESRVRAAARIADGIPAGVTPEAARRLVLLALRAGDLAEFVKAAPAPGSFEAIKARMDAAKAGAPAPTAPAAPARPLTIDEMAERMRAARPPMLYPDRNPKAEEPAP